MTRTGKNKPKTKVLGLNQNSKKAKQGRTNMKTNLLVNNEKNAGNLKDSKDKKAGQMMKTLKESPSIKKPISENQKNSPNKGLNKKKRNKKNKNKNMLKNENGIEKNESPNKDNIKSVIKDNKKQNINEKVQKTNSSQVFTKQKNVHKMINAVDTVPCPKDIQTQMNNRESNKNYRTLFVRFGKETGAKDRQTLMITFTDKVKEIRHHKKYKNINYVEFETREHLEEMKSQIEQMKTAGEKAFVDYMGDQGKKGLQDFTINPTKLFIRGFPKGTTPSQIKPLFNKCAKVAIQKNKYSAGKSYGFIFFNNESDAKAAFKSAQNLKIGGEDVTVLFSKLPTHETIKSDKKRQRPGDNDKENELDEGSPSKKPKVDKVENQEQEKAEEEQKQEYKNHKEVEVNKTSTASEESEKGCEKKANNDLEDKNDDEKKGEDMEEEEGDDMDEDEEEEKGDDKESEESEVDDTCKDDAEDDDDDDDDAEDDDDDAKDDDDDDDAEDDDEDDDDGGGGDN